MAETASTSTSTVKKKRKQTKAERRNVMRRRLGNYYDRGETKTKENDVSDERMKAKEDYLSRLSDVKTKVLEGPLEEWQLLSLQATFKMLKETEWKRRLNHQFTKFSAQYFLSLCQKIQVHESRVQDVQTLFRQFKSREIKKLTRFYKLKAEDHKQYKDIKPQWFWPYVRCRPEDVEKMNCLYRNK
jgi:hypothetical protein